MNKTLRIALASMLLAPVVAQSAPIAAQESDPANQTVQTLNSGLLSIMRAGSGAGQLGRARQIGPVIDRTFDLPLMTRLAVGPSWTGISSADQTALVAAFPALTITQYAKNFDSFSGERIVTAPKIEARGGDKLVRTTLVTPKGSQEALDYRLRQSGGQWKIIDVYYRNSISQLATRRADFAHVLSSGGAKSLIEHLNRLAASR